jgi:hypothetical protein
MAIMKDGGLPVGILFLGWVLFDLRRDVKELKQHITYADTCKAIHRGLDARIDRIERAMNGALKRKAAP